VNREGKPAGLGFDHLNFAPAQLMIKRSRTLMLFVGPYAIREVQLKYSPSTR
jgi:hypothetical protein